MAKIVMLKPAPGLIVRDPVSLEPLPPEGAPKERTSHWIRRINAGDVVEIPAAKTTIKPGPSASPAAKE